MTADEAYAALAAALRRAEEARDRNARELAELRATVDELVALLIARGTLAPGHGRHLARAAARAGAAEKPKVRLRVLVDKYQMQGAPDIDCAARIHLCQARCCALSFELSTQDLDEGVVRWEVEEPYLIRHERDGWCTHLDRGGGGCTIYAQRPAPCRGFDCRGDARVWIDFEQRVPAPMPEGLVGFGTPAAR